MENPENPRQPYRRVVQAAQVAAALIGAVYGYDFGTEIAGRWLGFLLAANCAVFGVLIVSAVAAWALRAAGAHAGKDKP